MYISVENSYISCWYATCSPPLFLLTVTSWICPLESLCGSMSGTQQQLSWPVGESGCVRVMKKHAVKDGQARRWPGQTPTYSLELIATMNHSTVRHVYHPSLLPLPLFLLSACCSDVMFDILFQQDVIQLFEDFVLRSAFYVAHGVRMERGCWQRGVYTDIQGCHTRSAFKSGCCYIPRTSAGQSSGCPVGMFLLFERRVSSNLQPIVFV